MQVFTPEGTREATPEEAKAINDYADASNGKAELRQELSKAVSLQQELDAIKKYLGVL